MTVYALILNYKTKEETLSCIESLKLSNTNKSTQLKIIIIDNASNDGIERALSQKHADVVFLQTGSNLGYTGGNNIGIRWVLENTNEDEKKKVNDTYILILNNDTIVHPDCIEELLKAHKRHPKAGILSPKMYFDKQSLPQIVYDKQQNQLTQYNKEKIIWSSGGIIDWANMYGSSRGVDQLDQGQYDNDEQVDFAAGTAMLIPLKVARELKEFDNNYFMYYEDVDLSLKTKKRGYEVWYVYKAVLWHKNAASSGMASPLQDYFITRNRLYIGTKYAPLRTKIALYREALRFRSEQYKWQGVKDFFSLRMVKGTFIKN